MRLTITVPMQNGRIMTTTYYAELNSIASAHNLAVILKGMEAVHKAIPQVDTGVRPTGDKSIDLYLFERAVSGLMKEI